MFLANVRIVICLISLNLPLLHKAIPLTDLWLDLVGCDRSRSSYRSCVVCTPCVGDTGVVYYTNTRLALMVPLLRSCRADFSPIRFHCFAGTASLLSLLSARTKGVMLDDFSWLTGESPSHTLKWVVFMCVRNVSYNNRVCQFTKLKLFFSRSCGQLVNFGWGGSQKNTSKTAVSPFSSLVGLQLIRLVLAVINLKTSCH